MTVEQVLRSHTPSLSDENENEIIGLVARVAAAVFMPDPNGEVDVADLAIRTCSCGLRIDGFYEYIDHLKEVSR